MIDLTGKTFGSLLVLHEGERLSKYLRGWVCSCDCGVTLTVSQSHLITGHTKSCGCRKHSRLNFKHGHSSSGGKVSMSGTYSSWRAMLDRCNVPSSPSYTAYGGRGIKVCDTWVNSFESFLSDMGERPDGCTLDRIDNSKDYMPSNCKWSTKSDQAKNRSTTIWITYEGETKCLSDWAITLGLPYPGLYARYKRGWSVDRCFTTPFRK